MQYSKTILLSTAYFAPVPYYSMLLASDATVIIEKHEHYNKQSYRNRCTIYSANGLLDLVVPVSKSEKPKILITDVKISYDTHWQKLHFKAIESAYRRSPFYEYYIDDLSVFFNRPYPYLYDFNMQIQQTMCKLMQLPYKKYESKAYIKADVTMTDNRNQIHPKVKPSNIMNQSYTQVFSEKYGFKPNLSILDLLFNEGPESKNFIKD